MALKRGKRPLTLVLAVCVVAGIGAALMPASAAASFPGTNGRIAVAHDTLEPSTDIVAIDPSGQNAIPLTSGPDEDTHPSYSSDGERIAFSRTPFGQPEIHPEIWVMNQDGTGQTQLTSGAFDSRPAFSPDGERIVFDRQSPGAVFQVWIMNADGSDETQLTFPGANGDGARAPSFSPDGQKIAFTHRDGATGFDSIWVMNPDGSGQPPLTSGPGDRYPDFSPDGQRIVFQRSSGGTDDVWVVNADGSGESQLTSGPDHDLDPAFAPDATRIAFDRDNPGFNFGNLVLADPTGLDQNVTPLTANTTFGFDEFQPTWQPLNPPALDLSAEPKQKSVKFVSVTATSQNEDATATIGGTLKAPKVPKARPVAAKAKRFELAPVTVELQPGQPATLSLPIPKKARKLLKRGFAAGKKGTASITATATDDLGASGQDSQQVKLKKKKK